MPDVTIPASWDDVKRVRWAADVAAREYSDMETSRDLDALADRIVAQLSPAPPRISAGRVDA